ncbi:DUF3105 domain-containing protein [Saccharomonospora piscinae]|uniref:DUF3105 domain-containing protein n=1 Tax=Saccharomonospora piscinae TaxID=687388 RepID=A0A1V9A5J3_SACPI|nr:DUF3105 domain-containing protein [Saccharomonospora piscinae]OQO92306.1 hypothetical protein B1813_08785 [Saccharomonospora piscinae]TLW91985.1 DUF3105 domain-containing protein [Saccharomonospora piscinae]
MANGKQKKGAGKQSAVAAARGSVVAKKQVPWGTIAAVVGIVLLAAGVFGYYYVASGDQRAQREREEAAASFAPSEQNPDPSTKIDGVVTEEYEAGAHVLPNERVAYDQNPPFGGPHDGFWAACTGIVYPEAVRSENMVHSLEHGAVWVAYNPDQVTGEALEQLKLRVDGEPFMMMSPFPGLETPISLQSWGHQLTVDSAEDERIDQFIAALRRNPNTYPEVGASCDALGPGQFDPDNPPAFNPEPPGPDAKPMDYQGTEGTNQDNMGGQPGGLPSSPAEG